MRVSLTRLSFVLFVESGTRNAAGVRTGTKTATTLTLGDRPLRRGRLQHPSSRGGREGAARGELREIGEALGRVVGWSLWVPAEALGIAVAICGAVGVLFGWLPARRAANLDPIEALRSE